MVLAHLAETSNHDSYAVQSDKDHLRAMILENWARVKPIDLGRQDEVVLVESMAGHTMPLGKIG